MAFTAYGRTLPGPMFDMGAGIRTPYGYVLPPGGNVVAYVNSNGQQDLDNPDIVSKLVTTLDAGLSRCRSGRGDIVMVMPDHAENISSADQMSSLVAGTRIVGMGHGTLRPTFTWTVAAASFLFDVADVSLENCILYLAASGNGGVTVAAPITVSAAGCAINDCQIFFGADADDIVTIGITTTAAADDFTFSGNQCYGATAAECTTFIRLVGADRLVMTDNVIVGATSSTTVGVVQFLTTASTDVYMARCTIANNKAASIHAATGMAGATGFVEHCNFHILDNATAAGLETEGNLRFSQCFVSNAVGENAITKTPVSV